MKKIIFSLCASAVLSVSSGALAGQLSANTVSNAAAVINGGADSTTASNKLVTLSTGVVGIVNYVAANNQSSEYAIGTWHSSGNKAFGTTADSTKMYWKVLTTSADFKSAFGAADKDKQSELFGVTGSGWTEY